MAEPTPAALQRASAILARSARSPGPVTARNIALQRNALIREIASALDELAGPLQALLQVIDDPQAGGGEAFRHGKNLAYAALRKFQGQPEAGLP